MNHLFPKQRFVFAVLILSFGWITFARLRAVQIDSRSQASSLQRQWIEITNRLAELMRSEATLKQQIAEARPAQRNSRQRPRVPAQLESWVKSGDAATLTPDAMSELRAELGATWNASDEYLWVSKSTLKRMSMKAVGPGGTLSDAVCEVLAITPVERAQVEGTLRSLDSELNAWAASKLQREGATDRYQFTYRLPGDPGFAASIDTRLREAVESALGTERAELFHHNASEWNDAPTQPLSFSLHQDGRGQGPLLYSWRAGGGNGMAGASPNNFPPGFTHAFPGGWREIAEREGFELPKEFQGRSNRP